MIRWFIISCLLAICIEANNFREGMLAYKQADYQKASEFFKNAIQIDHSANANYILGRMYLQGQGVEKDFDVAIKLLEVAEESGNIPSGCYLSEAYMKSNKNPSYIAWGLMAGLKKSIPHCKKVFQQYLTYQLP